MDTKNLILEEFLKNIEKELEEYKNNPKPIEVTLKEDTLDMLDDYMETQSGSELNQDQLDFYFENTKARELAKISYEKDTSYLGFHYFAWKELTTTQKVLTVLWFNELIAESYKKTPIPVLLNATSESAFTYGYMKDLKDYYMVINPFKLNDKDLIGAYCMHQIATINLEDNLNIALSDAKNGVKTSIKTIVLANYLKIMPKPQSYDEYMAGYDLTNEEERMVVLFAYQPLECELRTLIQEQVAGYMQASEEITQVPDTAWQEFKMNVDEDIVMLEQLKEKHYKNKDLTKLFEGFLQGELKYLKELSNKETLEK